MIAAWQKIDVPVALIFVGFLTILSGLLILLAQGCFWLYYGVWPELSLAYAWYWFGWPTPHTEWAAAMTIIAWVFDCSLSGVTFITGAALVACGANFGG